jgi:hypothetical protein
VSVVDIVLKGPPGRDLAQAVCSWLPNAAARVRIRAACGVCCRHSGTGAGFHRVLQFPLPIIISPISPSSKSPGAGTLGQLVAAMTSGPHWTPPSAISINHLIFIHISEAQWFLCVPPALTYQNCKFCPQSVSVCSVWFSQ